MMVDEDAFASPSSLEIDTSSPSEWVRGQHARRRLNDFHDQIIEEVEFGRTPPMPNTSIEGGLRPWDTDEDMKDYRSKHLPKGLVSELDEIRNASLHVLENMKRIEQQTRRVHDTDLLKENHESTTNRKIDRVSPKLGKPKESNKSGIPRPSGASNTTKRAPKTNARKQAPKSSGIPPPKTRGISHSKQRQPKPAVRNRIATKQVQARLGESIYQSAMPETETPDLLRMEMDSLRNDVEKLRSMSIVKANLEGAKSDTVDLLKTFPDLTNAIISMENDTSRATSELHRRIETLINSYRDMNRVAAQAPLGFLSAIDPDGLLKKDAARHPEWMPEVEPFDHQVLQAEADEILEQKRGLEQRLSFLLSMEVPPAINGKDDPTVQVGKKIRQIDQEVRKYVDQNYRYHISKEKGRPKLGASARRERVVAPWMGPTEPKDQSRHPTGPMRAPTMPRVLQLAEYKRRMEEVLVSSTLVVESEQTNTKQPAVEKRIMKPLVKKQKDEESKRTSTKPTKRRKPTKAMQKPKKEEEVPKQDSLDDIDNFLQSLETRRVEQEVFDAGTRPTTHDVVEVKVDEQMPSPKPPIIAVTLHEKLAEENKEEEDDECTYAVEDVLVSRIDYLVSALGSPGAFALRMAYETCHNIFLQSKTDPAFDVVNTSYVASTIAYVQTVQLYKHMVADLIAETLFSSKNEDQMDDERILFRLVEKSLGLDEMMRTIPTSSLVGVVTVAYQSVMGCSMSTDGKEALLRLVLTYRLEQAHLQGLELAGRAARAVYQSMIEENITFRTEAAVHAAESAFIKYVGNGTRPGPIVQSGIQVIAALGTWEGLGELGLTHIQSVICSNYQDKGNNTDQAGIRSTMSGLIGCARTMRDARIHAREITSLNHVIPKTAVDEDFVASILNQVDLDDVTEMENETLKMVVVGKVGSLFTHRNDEYLELNDVVRAKIVIDAAVDVTASSKRGHLHNIRKSLELVKQVQRRVELSINATQGIVQQHEDVLNDKTRAYVKEKYEDEEQHNLYELKEGQGHERVTVMLPRGKTLVDIGDGKPGPSALGRPSEEQLRSYISSNVLAEMLVREHNKAETTGAIIGSDQGEQEPVFDTDIYGAAVVQWFIDQGEIMQDEVVREATKELLSDQEKREMRQNIQSEQHTGEHYWSDENILDLVFNLYMQEQQEPERDVVSKTETRTETEITKVISHHDAEYAAAAALASRLAAESAERAVKEREASFKAQQEELDQQRQTLGKLQSEAEKVIAETALKVREEEVSRLSRELQRREEQQHELEEIRMTQLRSTIERVSDMQVATFSMAIDKIKDLIGPVLEKPQQPVVAPPVLPPIEVVSPTTRVEVTSLSTQTEIEAFQDEDEEGKYDKRGEQKDETVEDDQEEEHEGKSDEGKINEEDDQEEIEEHDDEEKQTSENSPKMVSVATGEGERVLYVSQGLNTSGVAASTDEQEDQMLKRRRGSGIQSTLLNWSDNDDNSSVGTDSSLARSLSEGELDVAPGDFSDGEEIPLTVAFRHAFKPPLTYPPWSPGEGPSAAAIHKTLDAHDDAEEDDDETQGFANLRAMMLTPEELAQIGQNESSFSSSEEEDDDDANEE